MISLKTFYASMPQYQLCLNAPVCLDTVFGNGNGPSISSHTVALFSPQTMERKRFIAILQK